MISRNLIFLTFFVYYSYSATTSCMDTLITCPQNKLNCNQYYWQQSCPLTCEVCKNPPGGGCYDTNTECNQSSCAVKDIWSQCNQTCGRCNGPTCHDNIDSCNLFQKPCSDITSAQCPLTCGVCTTNPVPTTSNTCFDHLSSCSQYSIPCSESVKPNCPATCGMCAPNTVSTTRNSCFDHDVSCPQYSRPCSPNVQITCPLSCGVCGQNSTTMAPRTTVTPSTTIKTTVPPTTTIRTTVKTTVHPTTTTKKPVPTTPKPPCKDSSPNCPTWAKNGFCTNTFYPPEKRKEYCAKTCKFC